MPTKKTVKVKRKQKGGNPIVLDLGRLSKPDRTKIFDDVNLTYYDVAIILIQYDIQATVTCGFFGTTCNYNIVDFYTRDIITKSETINFKKGTYKFTITINKTKITISKQRMDQNQLEKRKIFLERAILSYTNYNEDREILDSLKKDLNELAEVVMYLYENKFITAFDYLKPDTVINLFIKKFKLEKLINELTYKRTDEANKLTDEEREKSIERMNSNIAEINLEIDNKRKELENADRLKTASGGKKSEKSLESKTVVELKKIATERGIKVSGLKKADIIAKLRH